MEKGNLAKWLKKVGDEVRSGDVIAEIETDKATMEVEAVDEGTLGKILVPEGTNDVAVNTPIAMILAEGEDASALKDGKPATAKETKVEQPSREQKPAAAPPSAPRDEPAQKAEPAASRAAKAPPKPPSAPVGLARRHGRRNATRSGRVHHGRGGRRIPGRL
jgi:pyruvate/2-oxoglutarate dehydrogenase complex dihydrolipoamide acyltransferase (E2) component